MQPQTLSGSIDRNSTSAKTLISKEINFLTKPGSNRIPQPRAIESHRRHQVEIDLSSTPRRRVPANPPACLRAAEHINDDVDAQVIERALCDQGALLLMFDAT